ncbi:hypothetical protein [Absidia glauca]|uniref:Uncharacterized protein n=1 Tax=Absidia glauca TaxID=4829 RepID=A0A163M9Z2_ABSGL|nr:hypothetical protein [Absidia glauca]
MLDPSEPKEVHAPIHPDPYVSCPRHYDVYLPMEAVLASPSTPQGTELLVATPDPQDPGPTINTTRTSTQHRRVHMSILSGSNRRHPRHAVLLSPKTFLLADRPIHYAG